MTYLDDDVRISRSGDESLFVLERARRAGTPKPMLGEAAIEALSPEEAKTYDLQGRPPVSEEES